MRQLLIFVIAVLCIAEMAYATSPKEYSYVYDDDNSVGLAIPNSFNTDLRLALKEATNMNFAIAKGNGLSGTTLFLSYSADSLEIDSIKVLPDFKLYLDEWIDIQGHKARHLVYEYTIGEALFKYDTVLLVVNNVGYSISSYTLAAIFDNYKDTFSAIAASIQIKRNSKEFYSQDGRIKATLPIYMEQTQEDPSFIVGRHLNIWVVMYPRKTDKSIEQVEEGFESYTENITEKRYIASKNAHRYTYERDDCVNMFIVADKYMFTLSYAVTPLSERKYGAILLEPIFDMLINSFEVIE